MPARSLLIAAALAGTLAACATGPRNMGPRPPTDGAAGTAGPAPGAARMVALNSPIECVPYARRVSGIAIRGDAWTWWRQAEGRYARGGRPQVGAVLVLRRSARLRGGHLAVVKRVVSERVVLVDQANWLNRGRLHLDTPVRDVSAGNDWSLVRVWYTPGRTYGKRAYPAHGFIYPKPGPQAARAAPDPPLAAAP